MSETEPLLIWSAPDACTLPTVERPLRVREFTELFKDSLVGIRGATSAGTGAVLTFRSGQFERVAELARRELSCCSFFEFQTTEDENGVQLSIDVC